MSRRISPEIVLDGYCAGHFPMGGPNGDISWYSPDPRGVFPLDAFHVPGTLRKTIQRGKFQIRMNTSVSEVIAACGERNEGTWITPAIRRLYLGLHDAGYVHSVETWQEGRLVGGLYGVAIGAAFFGESMFHRITDASKVALVALVEHLRARDYRLLDTQWTTPHLSRFGAIDIPKSEYLHLLNAALVLPRAFSDNMPETVARPR